MNWGLLLSSRCCFNGIRLCVGNTINIVPYSHYSFKNIRQATLVSFLSLWQNTWGNQWIKGKIQFWLTVLEGLAHGQLAYCFWSCGDAVHHGASMGQSKTVPLMYPRKQKEAGIGWGPNIPFKGMPQDLTSFHQAPHPKGSINPIAPQAYKQAFNSLEYIW
jgi:hypothetical protein